MNAIEELRDYMRLTMLDGYTNVSEIVDRIEAEYMELPKDKNGEPIRVGDILKSSVFNKTRLNVIAIAEPDLPFDEILLSDYCFHTAKMWEIVKPLESEQE